MFFLDIFLLAVLVPRRWFRSASSGSIFNAPWSSIIASAARPSSSSASALSRWDAKRSSGDAQASGQASASAAAIPTRRRRVNGISSSSSAIELCQRFFRLVELAEAEAPDGGLEHLASPLLLTGLCQSDAEVVANRGRLRPSGQRQLE